MLVIDGAARINNIDIDVDVYVNVDVYVSSSMFATSENSVFYFYHHECIF